MLVIHLGCAKLQTTELPEICQGLQNIEFEGIRAPCSSVCSRVACRGIGELGFSLNKKGVSQMSADSWKACKVCFPQCFATCFKISGKQFRNANWHTIARDRSFDPWVCWLLTLSGGKNKNCAKTLKKSSLAYPKLLSLWLHHRQACPKACGSWHACIVWENATGLKTPVKTVTLTILILAIIFKSQKGRSQLFLLHFARERTPVAWMQDHKKLLMAQHESALCEFTPPWFTTQRTASEWFSVNLFLGDFLEFPGTDVPACCVWFNFLSIHANNTCFHPWLGENSRKNNSFSA